VSYYPRVDTDRSAHEVPQWSEWHSGTTSITTQRRSCALSEGSNPGRSWRALLARKLHRAAATDQL